MYKYHRLAYSDSHITQHLIKLVFKDIWVFGPYDAAHDRVPRWCMVRLGSLGNVKKPTNGGVHCFTNHYTGQRILPSQVKSSSVQAVRSNAHLPRPSKMKFM
jgi:hypothetical protein